MTGGRIISTGGGNVIAPGGGNVISAGGGKSGRPAGGMIVAFALPADGGAGTAPTQD